MVNKADFSIPIYPPGLMELCVGDKLLKYGGFFGGK